MVFQNPEYVELQNRYEGLVRQVKSFLQTTSFPSVKAHMLMYVSDCTSLEVEVISLKSEILMTMAFVMADYKLNLKTAYSNNSRFEGLQRWQSDIVVYGESSVVDSKKVYDMMESMANSLEEYKWLLKSNRELSIQAFKFRSGDE